MPDSMNVQPELLTASASDADAAAQNVYARHSAADSAVDSALFGWAGGSQAALAETAQRWVATTTALSIRIHRHSEALRVCALSFAAMDADHASLLAGIRPSGAL